MTQLTLKPLNRFLYQLHKTGNQMMPQFYYSLNPWAGMRFDLLEKICSICTNNAVINTMKQFKKCIPALLLLFFVLITGHTSSYAQSNEQLVEWLRDRYDTVDLLKADFVQHTTSPFGDEMPVNRGTLWLQDDLYRVETDYQTFVTNGETTWIFDTTANQVLVNNYVEDETTFSITHFLENFDSDYEVVSSSTLRQDGEKLYTMRLRARIDSLFFKEVTLWLRDTDHIISRMLVTDVNDAVLDFKLEDIEINPDLDIDPFAFVPPDDAEIIDLRS